MRWRVERHDVGKRINASGVEALLQLGMNHHLNVKVLNRMLLMRCRRMSSCRVPASFQFQAFFFVMP